MRSGTKRHSNYDEHFFSYLELSSLRSARIAVPIVLRLLRVNSILDVGCGAGAWLYEYRKAGVADVIGLDGDYVSPESLLVPRGVFRAQDVTRAFDLGRRFDLVHCLEVAEHLPAEASETLVANLARHGDRVLFSAAVPGQGGQNHSNEQSYEFWRAVFATQGFLPFDCLRAALMQSKEVEPWYRYNTLLYVRKEAIGTLPPAIRAREVPPGEQIADITPLLYRIRKRIIGRLSPEFVSRLAVAKHRVMMAFGGRSVGERDA
jgi:SAM-dependent methyltransferase